VKSTPYYQAELVEHPCCSCANLAVPQLEADAKFQRWAGSAGWASQAITLRVPSAWRPVVPDSRCHSSEYHQPGSTQPPIAWNTHFSAPVEQIPPGHRWGTRAKTGAGLAGVLRVKPGQEASSTWLDRPPGEHALWHPAPFIQLGHSTHQSVPASQPLQSG
jgi:hypothetical protein